MADAVPVSFLKGREGYPQREGDGLLQDVGGHEPSLFMACSSSYHRPLRHVNTTVTGYY